MKITLGKCGSKNVTLDLELLLTTRMLVTSDSGGGKTFALKRICEQVFGKMQILVVDPEGEFSPLRTRFDFLLAGPGGETPADVRSARLLATRLLETRASAVCDLYEMNPRERHEWLRLFLEGLIEAPKKLRHPCLVIVDEAHLFCPEHGKGESTASEMMIALCTRGRKRLLCPLFATQRLATLSKDASSMLLNRMIGPTFEDVNRKRAAEVLGIPSTKAELHAFFTEIKLLEPGHFYALGRAITRERLLLHVGAIDTPHGEEALKYETAPPPPLEKVKALMPKLADLPKQAEEKARTEAELRKEIRELKAHLRAQPASPVNKDLQVSTKVDAEAQHNAVSRAVDQATRQLDQQYQRQWHVTVSSQKSLLAKGAQLAKDLARSAEAAAKLFHVPTPELPKIERPKLLSGASAVTARDRVEAATPAPRFHAPAVSRIHGSVKSSDNGEPGKFPQPQLNILRALMEIEALGLSSAPKAMLAAFAGASFTSSSYTNNLGRLSSAGQIDYPQPGHARLTEDGRSIAPPPRSFTDSREILQHCCELVSRGQAAILSVLHEKYPDAVEKRELASLAGASSESSSYTNNLGTLRSAGMITYPQPGTAQCARWLFIE